MCQECVGATGLRFGVFRGVQGLLGGGFHGLLELVRVSSNATKVSELLRSV